MKPNVPERTPTPKRRLRRGYMLGSLTVFEPTDTEPLQVSLECNGVVNATSLNRSGALELARLLLKLCGEDE